MAQLLRVFRTANIDQDMGAKNAEETNKFGEASCSSCRSVASQADLAERWWRPRVAYDYKNLKG